MPDDPRTRRPHEIVAHLRKRRGLTLVAAAAQLGLSKSELSRIESGQRRLSRRHVALLAHQHGIDFGRLAVLLLGEGEGPPPARPATAPPVPALASVSTPNAALFPLPAKDVFPAGTTVVAEPASVIRPGGCFLPREGVRRIYRLRIDDAGQPYGASLCGRWRVEQPLRQGVLRVLAILTA
ncbi:MAG: helix-turn-helix transcriptional regulator [Alphaproteobacteria bacterium]|nr:helix-turn-helix transcriptional regulator [Alphaproteobacteria bacterium]